MNDDTLNLIRSIQDDIVEWLIERGLPTNYNFTTKPLPPIEGIDELLCPICDTLTGSSGCQVHINE